MMFAWFPLDWLVGLITAITLVYVYLVWNYDYWKKRGIPYERPQLLFGNYKDVVFVKKSVGTLTQDIYNKQQGHPYVGVFRFRTPGLLVRDPEIIKTILVKEFPSFDKNGFHVNDELDPLFARNPFFLMGERWKRVRTILSPAFTGGKLKPLFPLMEKTSKDLVSYLQSNATKNGSDGVEAKELSLKYTADVVASCAFGIQAGCLQGTESEFIAMNNKLLNTDLSANILFLFQQFFPAMSNLMKIRFMPLEVADFYRRIVKDMIAYRQNNQVTRSDFLHLLMQIKEKAEIAFEQNNCDGNGPAYTIEDVTAHAVTFITDGIETSSVSMSFLLYELAMNPDVQEKLRQELEEAVQGNDGKLTYELIHSLPYMNMTFTESMRMHPPLMTMEKICTKPCDLPRESGGTLQVEPGTLILIPVHGIHYDPKYYPEPDRFDPERFSSERKESIPKYAYLPFGDGPRVCIGMRFAQLQVKTGVAQVVLNYDIKPSAKTPKRLVQNPSSFLAGPKGGLWLDFVRRH